jgi:hypothetical protein
MLLSWLLLRLVIVGSSKNVANREDARPVAEQYARSINPTHADETIYDRAVAHQAPTDTTAEPFSATSNGFSRRFTASETLLY